MTNPLAKKLSIFADLSAGSHSVLEYLTQEVERLPIGHDLIREGERPDSIFLLVEGWAARYKILPDGSRQIVAYLIPGDLCDINVFILREMDHSIGLLSDAVVSTIPKEKMLEVLRENYEISQALFWSTLVDEAILREWLTNVGQRDAYARLAHLFCEMWLRMSQVDLVDNNEFTLPLTQEQLGDTIGLTPVHVNRTLGRLRDEGIISLSRKQLTIHDMDRLKKIAAFDPNYLHLERRR